MQYICITIFSLSAILNKCIGSRGLPAGTGPWCRVSDNLASEGGGLGRAKRFTDARHDSTLPSELICRSRLAATSFLEIGREEGHEGSRDGKRRREGEIDGGREQGRWGEMDGGGWRRGRERERLKTSYGQEGCREGENWRKKNE